MDSKALFCLVVSVCMPYCMKRCIQAQEAAVLFFLTYGFNKQNQSDYLKINSFLGKIIDINFMEVFYE
jgi:hypothetical protein